MRIGHYAPDLEARGGIARYVQFLSNGQAARGHEIVLLAQRPGRALQSELVTTAGQLFRRADDLNLDVLHLHRDVNGLPVSPIPTVRTMHGNQGSCPSGTRFLGRPGRPCDRLYTVSGCLKGHFVDRCGSVRPTKLFRHFSRIRTEIRVLPHMECMTVSGFLREHMVRTGYDPARLHVVHSPSPPADEVHRPVPDGEARFLFAGRLARTKGVDWLLRAFASMQQPARLDIAGEGEEKEAMMRLAAQLSIADRVTFHGWTEREALNALYRASRAVVFPSVWHEPAGLVTLEAAARGRAVVAGDVGGIPEYARDAFSLLLAPHDVPGLASALDTLAADRALADEMGRAGWHIARTDFSPDRFHDRVMEIYRLATERVGREAVEAAS